MLPAFFVRLATAFWMLGIWFTAAAMPTATGMQPPNRVISLTPHITELIFAAGGGAKLAATVNSSDYPPAARTLPRIGDGLSVNIEKLLSLDPDLVVAWQPTGTVQALVPTLQHLGIPLVYAAPHTLADIPREIIRLGKLLDTEDSANKTAAALSHRIKALREHYAGRSPVSVFLEVGSSPLYTLGNDVLINDVLAICAGVNVYADSSLTAPLVSTEDVLARQPDAIITEGTDAARLAMRQHHWATLNLPAAINHKVYAIDPDTLFRPGPRLVDAAEQLCRYLELARQKASTKAAQAL